MTWNRYLLVLMLLAALALPAQAGLFSWGKKQPEKTNPADRVGELIVAVKTDKDEVKRERAAEELRDFDPQAFPEITAILVDVLMHDPKPNVRAEAACSLGKLRPVCKEAGWALEQALEKDPSMRVRLQARTALWSYHWSGYQSTNKKDEPPLVQSKEPPQAPPGDGPPLNPPGSQPHQPQPRLVPTPMNSGAPVGRTQYQQTVPPSYTPPGGARPMPSGPPLVPAQPPMLQPPPAPSQGPDLGRDF